MLIVFAWAAVVYPIIPPIFWPCAIIFPCVKQFFTSPTVTEPANPPILTSITFLISMFTFAT